MSITPTYPGVYIEELPSTSHTITPAPTSIAAFVGYTHPLKTKFPGQAIELFSFADYQNNFGGNFDSPYLQDYVGQAVFQFFQNSGSNSTTTAYVVGLIDPNYTAATAQIDGSTSPPTSPITLTALEPVGVGSDGIPMQVEIKRLQNTGGVPNDTADIVIRYGTTQVDTYRKVLISTLADRLGTVDNPVSTLVTVSGSGPTSYPAGSPPSFGTTIPFAYGAGPNPTYDPQAITGALNDNQPLDKVSIFNLLVIPGVTDEGVVAEAVAYAERKRAFYIMDSPSYWQVDIQQGTAQASPPSLAESPLDGLSVLPGCTNAAIYYPWLQTTDPVTNQPITSPPSGFVAGIYAQEDSAWGVWKSPAGLETALTGTPGVVPSGVMTDAQQGGLNQQGINCLRQFPSLPPVVYGARTLAYRDPGLQAQWGYIAVRRMALFLEQSLYGSLTWAVFQPNDTPLWNALTQEVSAFMLGLFRQGAFAGTTPSQAFLVQCDATTTTQSDINLGIVNILVGFAPLKPAEFVVVKIAQLAGQGAS